MAALAAITGTLVACGDRQDAGPLNLGVDASETAGTYDIGTIVSFGSTTVRHEGDQDARIDDITLTPDGQNIGATVTGVHVLDLAGVTTIPGLGRGFPPSTFEHLQYSPAKGATIKAGTTVQLLFVVRIDQVGEWLFTSYNIRYRAGGRRYQTIAPHALRVCAPEGVACGTAPARTPPNTAPPSHMT